MRDWLWRGDRLLWAVLVPVVMFLIGMTLVLIRDWRRPIRKSIPAWLSIIVLLSAYMGWLFGTPIERLVGYLMVLVAPAVCLALLLDRVPETHPPKDEEQRSVEAATSAPDDVGVQRQDDVADK